MKYKDFLKGKVAVAKYTGFDVDTVNPALFPHQADTVKWCLKGGRRAVFASFGNGKTVMGLEIAHKCAEKTGKPSLICLPLGVRQEFVHDAEKVLGYNKPESAFSCHIPHLLLGKRLSLTIILSQNVEKVNAYLCYDNSTNAIFSLTFL